MAKFERKKGKATPKISTSSLPDIIFILLFFFMVATVLREVSLKVENSLPQATEIEKMKDKTLVKYVYIGSPVDKKTYGSSPRVQLNDAFAEVEQIGSWVESERVGLPENRRSFMKISMKVDKKTTIGIVTDVKQELRKANALYVTYTALPRKEIY